MVVVLACVSMVAPAEAQLNTQHIKGTVGLKSGSQPPPGVYFIAPLFYVYKADEVKDRNGDRLGVGNADLTSRIYGAGVNVVTKKKLFGGFYGFQVVFPVGANNRIQGTEIDANPGGGLTDSVISPISLGWHFKRADAIAGYTIFAPTGRYTDGASDNTGLGMWGQEFSGGTTVYLTESRQWHAATLATFDFQSKQGGQRDQGRQRHESRGRSRRRLPQRRADGWPQLLRVVQIDRRPDRGLSRHPHPRQEQGLRIGAGSPVGARKEQHALRLPEGELPVGGLRANGATGQRADDPGQLAHETSQASQSVSLQVRTMNMNHTISLAVIAAGILTSLPVARAGAQAQPTPDQMVAALKQNLAESQKRLRQDQWIETTAISLKGAEKSRKQQRVYYGADGKLTKVPVGEPPAPQAAQGRGHRGGRLKQQVVENKKSDMQEYMERAAALIQQYVPPDPAQIQKAKDAGHMALRPQPDGKVRVEFSDYVQPNDQMAIDVDAKAALLWRSAWRPISRSRRTR